MVRVLIVDDSSFMRRALGHLLTSDPTVEIAGTAADGVEALRLVKELRPDVVLLDLLMPQMDGLEALVRIMDECAVPVVVISGVGPEHATMAVKALELGAVDFIAKPSGPISYDIDKIRDEVVAKVKTAAAAQVQKQSPHRPFQLLGLTTVSRETLVIMGGSTGGAQALAALLPRLPQRLPAPMLVVLHIEPEFLPALAQRLGWECALAVAVACANEPLLAGKVALAGHAPQVLVLGEPGSKRLAFGTGPQLQAQAIDRAMESAADVYGPGTVGVLLSGMGQDGVRGLQAIKAAGGRTLVQDPASCLVGGMPQAAIDLGAADVAVPLDRLAPALLEMLVCPSPQATKEPAGSGIVE